MFRFNSRIAVALTASVVGATVASAQPPAPARVEALTQIVEGEAATPTLG